MRYFISYAYASFLDDEACLAHTSTTSMLYFGKAPLDQNLFFE
jgi:hypothetical protein